MSAMSTHTLIATLPATLLWAVVGLAMGADEAGKKIYADQCASCHGNQGQGVRDKYSDPLVGDRSLSSLTRYISKQMPDDKPGECTGERAEKVADYIFRTFYSTEAQLRRNPPRVELSRLTIGQYRATVADLVGDFNGVSPRDDRHGIKVEYYDDGRGFNNAKRLIERIESGIDVAFEGKPPSEKITAQEYAIRWSGAVIAPETGDYDFVLETTNGARLWLNDKDNPLIDVWVRSGDDPRHLASIRLLAGRAYALRLEVAKEKKEGKLTVRLKWKPPHQVEQLVPELMLSPGGGSQWLVLQTPFPPDDNILGYERGASVSKAWDDATTQAAFEVAGYVTSRMQRFTGVNPDGGEQGDARKKVTAFARRFAERAFRRPMGDELAAFYVDQHLAGDIPLVAGLRKVILLVLKSPRFLYNGLESDPTDPYVAASRMSYALWDSLPDAKLLEAAKGGRLKDREGIAHEVERMILDPRTQSKVRSFYHRWLKVDELRGLAKEANRFPGFDDALVSDLRVSLDLFLDAVTWSPASDYRQLMQSDTLYFNGRLAKFYGAMLPDDSPFTAVTLAGQPRAGVLTHPLLMAGFAYSATTSPIHRGVFVSRNLLGRRLRSPPDSIVPLSPDLAPDLTTRQRIGKQTKPPNCMTCHDMINPLGFTMEHFDAVGRMRMDEDGRAIDDSGSYRRMDGELASFQGAKDLAAFLASGGEAQGAFVERLFKDIVKQPILAYGSDERARLLRFFSEHDCSIKTLLAEIVTSATLAPAVAQKAAKP
jgi:cytochrome c553